MDTNLSIGFGNGLSSGTPIFGICLVYTTYIPCICRPHRYTWNLRGISMDIPRISNGVDIHRIFMDIPRISTRYRRGISMDIHGISFDVYTWYIHGISMDIPRFLNLDFSACPCCWSHSMCTRVLVIKSVLFHAPSWQLCQGIRRPTDSSLILSQRRRRLALRGAAGRLRGGRLGGLVLVTIPRCGVVAVVPPPPSPLPSLSPPSAAAAAAAAMAAAQTSFLPVSRSMISFLVSVGADASLTVQDLQGW
jgi:hypothetical protein